MANNQIMINKVKASGAQIQDSTNGDQDTGQDHGDIVMDITDIMVDTNIISMQDIGDHHAHHHSLANGDHGDNHHQNVDLAHKAHHAKAHAHANDEDHQDMEAHAHAIRNKEAHHKDKIHHHKNNHKINLHKDHHTEEADQVEEENAKDHQVHHLNGACMDMDPNGAIQDMVLHHHHQKEKMMMITHQQEVKKSQLERINKMITLLNIMDQIGKLVN